LAPPCVKTRAPVQAIEHFIFDEAIEPIIEFGDRINAPANIVGAHASITTTIISPVEA
jgi:hypothetical protein